MCARTCLEVMVFGPEYLRESNVEDTTRLMAIGESIGLLGMLRYAWFFEDCGVANGLAYEGVG